MKLTRVTITGADDAVDPQALVDLRKEFPFVEWGILRSEKKEGTPRYPTLGWICRLEALLADRTAWAAHLCGSMSRLAMAGDPSVLRNGPRFGRYQLNGSSSYKLPMLLAAMRMPECEFILQATGPDAFCEQCDFVVREKLPNLAVLFDPSGGRGKVTTHFPSLFRSDLDVGFAGGINIENVRGVVEELVHSRIGSKPFWIDLETGARTNDDFDLKKVREILELVRPLVGLGTGEWNARSAPTGESRP